MSTLIITVQPFSELDEPAKARSRVVVHYQEIVFEDDNGDVISREASSSFDVSPEFTGQTEILDYVPETSINLSLTSSQGMVILSEDVDKPAGGPIDGSFVYVWKLNKPEVEKVVNLVNRKPLYPAILNRRGHFVSIGFPSPPFSQYKLMISPIRQTEIRKETLSKLFNIETFGTVAKRLWVDDLPELTNLPLGELITTKISINGQFEFSVPVDGNETGWIWLLNGPVVFIGIQDEENLDPIATRRTILLPPPSRDSDEDGETASDIPIGGVDRGAGSSIGSHAIDVSEEELLSNPDIFNDDPGSFCRPFSNPHRIVSERTFHSILRIEQPTIGSRPYVRPDITIRETAPENNNLVAVEALAPRGEDDVNVDNLPNELAEFIRAGVRATRATAARPISETALTSLIEIDPAIKLNPALYKTYITGYARKVPRGRFVLNANQPLNWEGNSTEYQATSLAFGHILETRVQWRTNGYSLGRVVRSLTLAPRQTKRIVTIQSSIADRIQRTEATNFSESVETETTREYSYQDQIEAHLSEWSRGRSFATQAGGAGGVGGFINGILFSGGGALGIGVSGSTQRGGRDIAAQETQKLQDGIRTYGDSLRQLDSMVVVDQSQEEFVQGVSEVVRNINYCHSLTIIYHEILRHLRVDTRVVGARECVFVPFEIKPFTIARTLKWRDTIRRILRRRDLRWVMPYLPDVLVNFAGSAIPNLRRDQIPIINITGSIYIQLKIERPKDSDVGEFIEDNWKPLLPFTVDPIFGIFSSISALLEEKKDQAFQSRYAPKIATNWANNLKIYNQDNLPIANVDFTLANSYRFGGTIRVDFSLSDDSGDLTRSTLKNIKVEAPALPKGSIANVKQIRFRYTTEHFDYQVSSPRVTNDLIVPETGEPESGGATVHIPTRPWEEVNLRREIEKAVAELLIHLDEYTEYYHKMIWWNLDRDKLYMMLDGIKLSPEDERSVASVVERNPLAVVGNSLVYRVAAGAFIGVDGHQDADSLNYHYRDTNTQAEPLRISLPTSGLYAQSIMDECEACEEHFGSTEWVLTNDEPELAELGPQLLTSRRAQLPDATPSNFPDSIINIHNPATPPAPSGFTDLLNALTNPNSFRDMAGLEGTQANARAAMGTAAKLASEIGQGVVDLYKAQLSADNAKNKMSAIDKAHQKGSIDDAERKRQTKKVLDEMNQGANTEETFATAKQQLDMIDQLEKQGSITGQNAETARKRVIENLTGQLSEATDISSEDLSKLIEQASIFGADVKKDGASFEINTASNTEPLIVEVNVTPALRAFGPNNNITGVTTLSVRGKNLPSGATLRWSIPTDEAGKYTISQRMTTNGVSEVTISGIQPGLTNIDVEALDGGTRIASIKFPLSIPQFITIDDNNALFDDFITNNNFQAIQSNILEEVRPVVDLLLLSHANVRLIWASQGGSVPAHIPANFVTTVVIGNEDPSGDEAYGVSEGAANAGDVGDTFFNERISIFPASFLAQGLGSTDIDTATNELVRIITSIQASEPDLESWVIRFFGRLMGETLSHEIYHALLPVPFVHNVNAAGDTIDTGDMMDEGQHRSFAERTGIIAISTTPDQFIANLTDSGRGAINKLTNANHLAHIHSHFPIPPTPPFDI